MFLNILKKNKTILFWIQNIEQRPLKNKFQIVKWFYAFNFIVTIEFTSASDKSSEDILIRSYFKGIKH